MEGGVGVRGGGDGDGSYGMGAKMRSFGHNQCGMLLMEPIFPPFVTKVIFLTLLRTCSLKKILFKNFD